MDSVVDHFKSQRAQPYDFDGEDVVGVFRVVGVHDGEYQCGGHDVSAWESVVASGLLLVGRYARERPPAAAGRGRLVWAFAAGCAFECLAKDCRRRHAVDHLQARVVWAVVA